MDNAGQHISLRLTNDIRDRRRVGERLQREHASGSVRARDQLLANDSPQRFAHHHPNLLLLIGRKDIEQTVEGARSVASMQRSQNKMSRLGGGDRERDRFQIAHLADHDYIRVFAQGSTQRRTERARVRVHFALGDVAILRLKNVFDRILERDDVFVTLDIHLLDQRRQRRRFSTADGAGDEDQSIMIARKQLQVLRQAELVHRPDVRINNAEDEIDPEPLPHHAGAITPMRIRISKIGVAPGAERFALGRRQETFRQLFGLRRSQLVRVSPDGPQRSVQSPGRRGVDAEMNVRCAVFHPDREVFIDGEKRRLVRRSGDSHGAAAIMRRSAERAKRKRSTSSAVVAVSTHLSSVDAQIS